MAASKRTIRNRATRVLLSGAGMIALLASLPASGSAQYFGRNKVQYDGFDFKVLSTQNWDIHYYPQAETAIEDIARLAERWYERFSRVFQHDFDTPKPLIMYADHPDFQQTNTLAGAIGQGTGGVTESLKNRVIMPLNASYRETDRILGHELVHAFQYNISQSRSGGGDHAAGGHAAVDRGGHGGIHVDGAGTPPHGHVAPRPHSARRQAHAEGDHPRPEVLRLPVRTGLHLLHRRHLRGRGRCRTCSAPR